MSALPDLPKPSAKKLARSNATYTVAEVVGMLYQLAESIPDKASQQRISMLIASKHLLDSLQEAVVAPSATKMKRVRKKPTLLYQFRITLLDISPPIWRRILVLDCTLDKLHEHIQTAMGWTNSHLHDFEIRRKRYGDPELLDDGFEDFDCIDSTATMISDIVPKNHRKFAFRYQYDFGDGWDHEVLFERCATVESGSEYPVCTEGRRACPPEDIGGAWGYEEFLEAMADPDHEEHERLREWYGSSFSPDEFDPQQATKAMRQGLPDWREM